MSVTQTVKDRPDPATDPSKTSAQQNAAANVQADQMAAADAKDARGPDDTGPRARRLRSVDELRLDQVREAEEAAANGPPFVTNPKPAPDVAAVKAAQAAAVKAASDANRAAFARLADPDAADEDEGEKEPDKVEVNLIKTISLTLQNGEQRLLTAGKHMLEKVLAIHWYVVAHTAPDPEEGTVEDPNSKPADGFTRINIVKPFVFTHPNGETMPVAVGMQDLPDAVASHWFTQGHSDDPPDAVVQPGTAEYADLQKQRMARQHILDVAAEQAASTARDTVRDQTKANPPVDDMDPGPDQPQTRRRRAVPAAAPADSEAAASLAAEAQNRASDGAVADAADKGALG